MTVTGGGTVTVSAGDGSDTVSVREPFTTATVSGGNETYAVGGDVIASETGNGSADGGKGTGGAAYANGGTAVSGDAKVVNSAYVSTRIRR